MSKLLFPKPSYKKKRKKHRKSILQSENTKECYICSMLGHYQMYTWLEEHHIFFGTANRKLSEEYGLKVMLCGKHHKDSREGVHFNENLNHMLRVEAQKAFEREYPGLNFRKIFGINYLEGETDGKAKCDDYHVSERCDGKCPDGFYLIEGTDSPEDM